MTTDLNTLLSTGMGNALGEELTPAEELLVQGILFNKANLGLSARLCVPRRRFTDLEEREAEKGVESIMMGLDLIASHQTGLLQKYASQMGVAQERFHYLVDKVYELETTI